MKTAEVKQMADKRYDSVGKMMHRYMDKLLILSNKHFIINGEEQDIVDILVETDASCEHVLKLQRLKVGHGEMMFINGEQLTFKRIG